MSGAPPKVGTAGALSIVLNPLQEQVIASLASGATYVAIRAGWGSGKTTALVFGILYRAVLYPGEQILLITDTSTRFDRVLMPELTKWLRPLGWTYIPGRNITGRWVEPGTGTAIVVVPYWRAGTRDQAHNPLEGINAGSAFVDECQTLQQEVAVKAFGRVRASKIPVLVMVGLPVADAWWVRYAAERGGRTLFAISHVNAANLGARWLEEAERLPAADREAMIYNRPQAPEGQVYREWAPVPWPAGNLTPPGWTYRPEMDTRIAADWGVNKPWIGVIAFDPALDADVLVAELSPRDVSVPQLIRLILQVAWPREFAGRIPQDGRPRFLLDAGCGDRAGRGRNDTTLTTIFDQLARPPPSGRLPRGTSDDDAGIGLALLSSSAPTRVVIANGVQRTRSRIMERSLLCEAGLWRAGLDRGHDDQLAALGVRANGNTFARAIMSYRYPDTGADEPVKSGLEDPMDAIRYDTINFRWNGIASLPLPTRRSEPTATRAVEVAGAHTSWRARGVGR